jgi:hypothetical protein
MRAGLQALTFSLPPLNTHQQHQEMTRALTTSFAAWETGKRRPDRHTHSRMQIYIVLGHAFAGARGWAPDPRLLSGIRRRYREALCRLLRCNASVRELEAMLWDRCGDAAWDAIANAVPAQGLAPAYNVKGTDPTPRCTGADAVDHDAPPLPPPTRRVTPALPGSAAPPAAPWSSGPTSPTGTSAGGAT